MQWACQTSKVVWCFDRLKWLGSTHEKAFQYPNQEMAPSSIWKHHFRNCDKFRLPVLFKGYVSHVKIGRWCDRVTSPSPTFYLLSGLAWHAFYIQTNAAPESLIKAGLFALLGSKVNFQFLFNGLQLTEKSALIDVRLILKAMFTFQWQSCQFEQLPHLRTKATMWAIFTILTACTVCTVATMWAIFTIWCHFWPTVPPSLVLPYFLARNHHWTFVGSSSIIKSQISIPFKQFLALFEIFFPNIFNILPIYFSIFPGTKPFSDNMLVVAPLSILTVPTS